MSAPQDTGSTAAEREDAPGHWKPHFPEYEQVVRDTFAEQPAMAHIGATLGLVEPGLVEIHLPCTPQVMQQYDAVHGGVIGMIADSACGFAALTIAPRGTIGVTVEYKINLLAPAIGEELLARGRLIRPGTTLTIASADVYVFKERRTRHVATALETLIRLQ
jgi:uncharacterized protein (TIGR00369 family)